MPTLPPSVEHWRNRGDFVDACGMRVFVVDTGPASATDVVLVLHGFPTSSHDWHRALPQMGDPARRRFILFDMPGYGLSDKPAEYSYSLMEQADVAEWVLRQVGVSRAHIVAHDMGTSVACELMARRERRLLSFQTRSLLLMNGSVHIELAHLTPSQRLLQSPLKNTFARLGSGTVFKAQLRRICGQPLSDEDLEAMWAQILHLDGKLRLPRIIEYLGERRRFWHRWIGALTRLSELPTHVLWGPLDRVAVPAIATQLAREIPDTELEWLEGLGHYPMLEDPDRTGAAVRRWLDRAGAAAHS
ncbi:MAG: alpha/beta fold hydrolase [Myxococcota bacterium]